VLTGVSSVEWKLEIVNDGIEEGNDEKFKLFLENATNAVLGNSDRTQINLIDFEDGKHITTPDIRDRLSKSIYISVYFVYFSVIKISQVVLRCAIY